MFTELLLTQLLLCVVGFLLFFLFVSFLRAANATVLICTPYQLFFSLMYKSFLPVL